jgi:hypothetical protein
MDTGDALIITQGVYVLISVLLIWKIAKFKKQIKVINKKLEGL